MKCSNCLKEALPGKFCNFCGYPLNAEVSASSVVPNKKENSGITGVLNEDKSKFSSGNTLGVPKTPASKAFAQINKETSGTYSNQRSLNNADFSEGSPGASSLATTKKLKMAVAVLYVLIMVVSVALGSFAGYLSANGRLNIFSSSKEKKDNAFHWNDPVNAIESVYTPEDVSATSDAVQ